GDAEAEYHVVVARVAPPSGLPSLAHRSRVARPVQRHGGCVEAIAARYYESPGRLAGKIRRDAVEEPGVRHHLTEGSQARHPAVREHRQAQVREAQGLGHSKRVRPVAFERRARNDLDPLGSRIVELGWARIAFQAAGLDLAELRVVAGEEARVHL